MNNKLFLIAFIFFSVNVLKAQSIDNIEGTYICNDNQQVTILVDSLYIGNASFKLHSSQNGPTGLTHIFIYKTDFAMFMPKPNEKNIYDLNIRAINNKNDVPYVGLCKKIE